MNFYRQIQIAIIMKEEFLRIKNTRRPPDGEELLEEKLERMIRYVYDANLNQQR